MAEEQNKVNIKKKLPEVKPEEIKVRLDDKWVHKLMREKLGENACRNRGYILDGFPRTFSDSQQVFLVRKKKMIIDEEGNQVPDPDDQEEPEQDEEELPPGEERKEKNFENYETDSTISPSCFIRIDGEDA